MRPSNRQRLNIRRPYATTRTLNWIATRACWHLDAWLASTPQGLPYFYVETHAGGWERLGAFAFAVRNGDCEPVQAETIHDPFNSTLELTPALNVLHWRYIAPLAELWPRGEYPRRSVVFHYVRTIPCEPMDGLPNWYSVTGRAYRDRRAEIRTKLQGLLTTPESD